MTSWMTSTAATLFGAAPRSAIKPERALERLACSCVISSRSTSAGVSCRPPLAMRRTNCGTPPVGDDDVGDARADVNEGQGALGARRACSRHSAKGMRSTATGVKPASCTAFTLAFTASLTAATSRPCTTGPPSAVLSEIG